MVKVGSTAVEVDSKKMTKRLAIVMQIDLKSHAAPRPICPVRGLIGIQRRPRLTGYRRRPFCCGRTAKTISVLNLYLLFVTGVIAFYAGKCSTETPSFLKSFEAERLITWTDIHENLPYYATIVVPLALLGMLGLHVGSKYMLFPVIWLYVLFVFMTFAFCFVTMCHTLHISLKPDIPRDAAFHDSIHTRLYYALLHFAFLIYSIFSVCGLHQAHVDGEKERKAMKRMRVNEEESPKEAAEETKALNQEKENLVVGMEKTDEIE